MPNKGINPTVYCGKGLLFLANQDYCGGSAILGRELESHKAIHKVEQARTSTLNSSGITNT